MKGWIDAVAYQVVWFCAVIGAGNGSAWPGVIAGTLFAIVHLVTARSLRQAVVLMLLGIAFGLLVDGSLARAGMAHYAANWSSPFAWIGAPPWILALWVAFALTLTRSFAVLQTRPALAAVIGALGGPLAYIGAGRAWHAVELQPPTLAGVVVLSLGWAIALPVLATTARRLVPPQVLAAPVHGAMP